MRARADAFVTEASRRMNFGRERALLIDAAPTMRTYVRFDVDLRSDEISHVSLLLFNRDRSRGGYKVQLATRKWRENRINFVNAPDVLPQFVSSGPLRAHAWKAVDVTALAAGQGKGVSFVLTTRSAIGVEFASRETGLHGPRLVVEKERVESTRSTTTSTEGRPLP